MNNEDLLQFDANGLIKILLCNCDDEKCQHKISNEMALEFLMGKGVLVHYKEDGEIKEWKPTK